MQLSLAQASDPKYFWAFARDEMPPVKRYIPSLTPRRNLNRYRITSCSRQARAYGVRIGMAYSEARKLVPAMRVIVVNR
jgi:nucleotidyltransferase/DNA polymerase involved in DNA repair